MGPRRHHAMRKRTFVIFGVLAVCLAVLIPFWAFRKEGDEDSGTRAVPSSLEQGKELFATNCGNCHTLAAAGTQGNFGPDLDDLLAPQGQAPNAAAAKGIEERVLAALRSGVDTAETPGRMPAGMLAGEQAETVAVFIGREAGK
jgi:mono/diheme cytochrome c family protein